MDSKEEEQARGITMKSSSISLLFVPGGATRPEGPNSVPIEEKLASGILVNLIDSPGHVDFCSEVSTAARLSDGAFVVVDAVEGVCIQTHAVLRQAWEEKVAMCLVVNKIDRLILELRLTPEEAYERLVAIIAHVNMIVSSFRSEKFISEADSVLAYEDAKASGAAAGAGGGRGGEGSEEAHNGNGAAGEGHDEHAEDEDEEDMFSPSKGNVAFASAHDGWAFRPSQFAEMYAAKLGCKAAALERAMWGDYAFQPKLKRIVKIKADQRGRLKPLFVAFALDPLWKAYKACDPEEDHVAVLGKIIQGLGLKNIPERSISTPDSRSALRSVLRAWLPLSEAVLGMAAEHLPSPRSARDRVPRLLPPRKDALRGFEESPELAAALDAMELAVSTCDSSESAPTVIYVSKMVAVPASALPRAVGEPGPANPNEERFLAFGRVFSGVVRAGQVFHVLSSVYNPADPSSERLTATATALYLMMGRGLERLPAVPAGNVLALAGLEQAILKSATVASTPLCRPLAPLLFQSAAIVRVAVEPAHPGDMPALVEGLRLLHRADPLVQVSVQENGEHVLAAAGEVHLETCIKDLRDRFARVELLVSPPLVAFRETVVAPEEEAEAGPAVGNNASPAPPRASTTAVEVMTPSGACTIRVRASPIPAAMASALDQNADALKAAFAGQGQGGGGAMGVPGSSTVEESSTSSSGDIGAGGAGATGNLTTLGQRLRSIAEEHQGANAQFLVESLDRIWLLGPKRCGPNFLLVPPGSKESEGHGNIRSLFDLPPQQVVKIAKQHPGRAPSTASLALPTGAGGDGGSYRDGSGVENTLESQIVHVPLQLGSPLTSQRLGLSPSASGGAATTAEAQLNARNVQAAAEHLARQLDAVNLTDGGDAQGGIKINSELAQYVQHSVESGVVAGFEMATAAGPLCDEPMWGLSFLIEARLNLNPAAAVVDKDGNTAPRDSLHLLEDVYGPFSGQVTSAARQAVRRAVLEAGPRLAEAAFLCEVTTSSEGLSAVYAVLGRRRSRVLREEMREGSDLFTIHAYLPAEASFGFVDELRRRSSGAASASLMLSHWERLAVDPFFVPLTEEEREEFGEEGQGVGAPNLAKRLIDSVRKRKGLAVEQKVVESATRQRTLARKV